jgi:hypothetical protein
MSCISFVKAQDRVLSETDFNRAWKKSCEKTRITPHSSTETIEKYDDESNPPYYSYVTFRRYIPPDRVWTVAGPKGARDQDKYEEIRIGTASYSRDGNGVWKQKQLEFSGLYYCEPEETASDEKRVGTGNLDRRGGIKLSYEYRFNGREKLGNQVASVYVRSKIMTVDVNTETQTRFTTKYWLGDNGLLLLTERTTRTNGTQRWERELSVNDYSKKDFHVIAPIN